MKTLINKDRIQTRISEMAEEIDGYYYGQDWYRHTNEPVIVIGILSGAIFFMADLVRQLSIRTKLDFIRASSYPGETIIAKELKITDAPILPLRDAHVLLIDDIFDTGNTLRATKELLTWSSSKDIKTTVLLRKPDKAPSDITIDFVGFDIPDKFVIGYGLDYDGEYRKLSYIATLE